MDDESRDFLRRVEAVAARERLEIKRSGLTRAAVLVPFVPRGDGLRLIVTKRTMRVATHKGQISFPGGAWEPADANPVDTALREAEEEIGLDPRAVSVIGLLDDFATTSGFAITPVAGVVDPDAAMTPDPTEVEEIFEVPLKALRDPTRHELVTEEHETLGYRYHRYDVEGRVIWGATAGIIHRFLAAVDAAEAP